ncbi:MAG: 1-acyl-sn-glycerol-3-phosphate acyltransferase [Cellvibrionaceae bacterium]|nr:1-acyl-sn-glycerol-3-phosphate acyltransferase [Cellvibrionaceae bacterium]
MATASCQACNKYWRIFATGFSFILFGVGTTAIGCCFLIIAPLPWPATCKQDWIRRAISCSCQGYIRTMKHLGLLTYRFELQQSLTQGGNLIIANHPSLLDAIFLLAAYNNLCCVAKRALWHNPFTAIAVRLAGYIPNSGEDFIEQAAAKLAQGENILIFPEGTRNRHDTELNFKRGAANIAVKSQCKIAPILIRCTPRTLQKQDKWYQVPEFVPHFFLQEYATIKLHEAIDTERPQTLQYRHLTQYLRQYYLTKLS